MKVFVLILLLNSVVLCQTIEDGWKGIKPLETNKTKVDKLLGKPEIDDNGYYNYRTDEAFIQVNYSENPCSKDNYGRGKYTVAKDTVLSYWVHLKEGIKLSEFNFDREKYYKDTSGDLKSSYDFYNDEDGIGIDIGIQGSTEKDPKSGKYIVKYTDYIHY